RRRRAGRAAAGGAERPRRLHRHVRRRRRARPRPGRAGARVPGAGRGLAHAPRRPDLGGAAVTDGRDGRVARGERPRAAVLRRAADIASVEGLDGVSIGRLAAVPSVSKAGVFAHVGLKEELQVATRRAAGSRSRAGLGVLSIGRRAAGLSVSKAGVFAHFGSKEELQVATVRAAARRFAEEVVAPAAAAPEGLARVVALGERWLDYSR